VFGRTGTTPCAAGGPSLHLPRRIRRFPRLTLAFSGNLTNVSRLINERFSDFARALNASSASPAATALAIFIIVVWAVSGPFFRFSDGWQLTMNTISSVSTFAMVFVLNNAQSRDTRAMNLKLDELIRSMDKADNRVIALEEKPAREAETVVEAVKQAIDELTKEAEA
jgi:low affinity Fe/Cu permease